MVEEEKETRFAPSGDTLDGRKPGEWESRYKETGAIKMIRVETIYLVGFLALVTVATLYIWLEWPMKYLAIEREKYQYLCAYIYTLVGGTLGGIVFSMKWLYHSVARGIWNLDRRLWRMLTPIISGVLSLCIYSLMRSGLITVFDGESLSSGSVAFSMGFLVGYFSDSAIAKMAEIAETIFGVSSDKKR